MVKEKKKKKRINTYSNIVKHEINTGNTNNTDVNDHESNVNIQTSKDTVVVRYDVEEMRATIVGANGPKSRVHISQRSIVEITNSIITQLGRVGNVQLKKDANITLFRTFVADDDNPESVEVSYDVFETTDGNVIDVFSYAPIASLRALTSIPDFHRTIDVKTKVNAAVDNIANTIQGVIDRGWMTALTSLTSLKTAVNVYGQLTKYEVILDGSSSADECYNEAERIGRQVMINVSATHNVISADLIKNPKVMTLVGDLVSRFSTKNNPTKISDSSSNDNNGKIKGRKFGIGDPNRWPFPTNIED